VQTENSPSPRPLKPRVKYVSKYWWVGVLIILAIAGGIPALRVQKYWEQRTLCQTNLRRLSTSLLLYAQDYEGALPPPESRQQGVWRSWVDMADPYKKGQDIEECPANPAVGARHAVLGYPFPCSYALNYRFFGVFAPGPFAVENVEIPAQTALLVEAGWQRDGGPFGPPAKPLAMSAYFDTAQMPAAYPSPHNRRMSISAIDGHTVCVKVAHYSPAWHDPMYGRVGRNIYNWNGGHPNGNTGSPPRE
jgi:hypothetical protein